VKPRPSKLLSLRKPAGFLYEELEIPREVKRQSSEMGRGVESG